MKNMLLAVLLAAAPAAAQMKARMPVSGPTAIPGLGASFDGARLGAAPLLMPTLSPGMQMPALSALALIPTLTRMLVQPAPSTNILAAAAEPVEGSPLGVIRDASANETPKAATLDRLFENSAPSSPEAIAVSAQSAALVKFGTGGTAVLRYGRRNQYEMSVFAFPGSQSISFKEYSANPMGRPKQSFDATLETAAARKAAAKILRAAQARNSVSGKDKATLDAMLALLSVLVRDRPQHVASSAKSKDGVYSAKSKDSQRSASDLEDGKHTGLSGTSMAGEYPLVIASAGSSGPRGSLGTGLQGTAGSIAPVPVSLMSPALTLSAPSLTAASLPPVQTALSIVVIRAAAISETPPQSFHKQGRLFAAIDGRPSPQR